MNGTTMTTGGGPLPRAARPRTIGALALLLVLAGVTGCATSGSVRRADAYALQGDWDAAILYYQQALETDPGDVTAQRKLQRAQTNASQLHRVEGNKLAAAGDLQRAQLELELAVRLDPTNEQAVVDLRRVNEELATIRARAEDQPTAVQRAIAGARQQETPAPRLQVRLAEPMTFDYRRARIREVYRSLARLARVNVLLDPDLDNEQVSFFIEDITWERALDLLTRINGHFYKVLTPNTFLVAPDNQNKRRQYDDEVLRTFYLSNADVEPVANTLRAVLQSQFIAEDATLNSITIRDTPENVVTAERLIRSLDKARGEVLLNIEIFEVDRGVMDQYGLSLSNYSSVLSVDQGAAGLSLDGIANLTNADVFVTVPSLRYQFMRQNADFRLIAQPQLRASDGQLSELLVGEERPIVTTTFNPQNTSGGDVIPIATTEYREVGISIGATPRVHHDGQVTLQLAIQVSAVQEGAGSAELPVFTARTLNTTLRLREGETNLLAGLLRDDERTTLTGLPILSDIPLIRDLFSKTEKEIQQTDVVMSITPYIVRMADITEEDLGTIAIGSGAASAARGGGGRRGGARGGGDDDASGGPSAPAAVVRVLPAQANGVVGQVLSFDISVQGQGEVNNAGLRVSFDPGVLRLVDVTEGALLGSDGTNTSFQSAGAGGGSVAIGIGRIGSSGGVVASGVLATLQLEAIAAGDSTVQISSAALRGPDGRPLPISFEPARVTVSQ